MDIQTLLSRSEVKRKFARRVVMFGQRLQRLPRSLGQHPGLLFSPTIQGYRDYTFGARSGPSVQVRHMFHELGHAAQFGPDQFKKRVGPEGYVFKMPQKFGFGRYFDDPHTCLATNRELDTNAHELHLMQAAGFKCDVDKFISEWASTARLMPDWALVPGEKGKGRHTECMRRLREYYENITQAEVLDKLEGWLDLTDRRLRRKHNRPYHEEKLRFRSDGSLFQG